MGRAAAKRRAVDDDEQEEQDEQTDYDSNDSGGGARSNKRKKTTVGKRAPAKSQSKNKGKGKGKKRADSDEEDDDSDDGDDSSDSDRDGQAGKGKKGDLTEEASSPLARNTSNNLLTPRPPAREQEKKFYIQGMVRWILFNESHRRVLRRQDIVKAVLTDGRGRHFTSLLPKVQKILREVLGLDLVALRQKESATGKAQPKAYVVRSIVPLPLLRHVQTHRYSDLSFSPTDGGDQNQDQGHNGRKKSLRRVLSEWHADGDGDADDDGTAGAVLRDNKREEGALYGILGVVLALILVNGKVLGDDQLVSYLKRLSLTPSTTLPLSLASPHPDSITLSSFLSTLVKQQYLERGSSAHLGAATQGGTKSQARTQTQRATQKGKDAGAEAGDPAIEWRWGPRSEVEFGEVGVAKFVHQVFTDPSSLPRGAQSQTQTQTQGGKGGGDRFLAEVARAAGVKKLAGTERNKGGGADGEEEEEGGEEESE
ncbi:hypothetical protein C6P46_001139 [Rhodotorula mucilaginosa]|uniref:MAGE domain-containing protein n=1 Tax=Rhodotorula mucilaginosa TaxID=5537 RepID=A0A9P6VTD4_RHOMI|nr:hypothetical protein C6P46_001139 [Rhodotorula mucilaginosa]